MIVFRILATIFVAISCITTFIKNVNVFNNAKDNFDFKAIIVTTIWGWLWRAFVIVALWVI